MPNSSIMFNSAIYKKHEYPTEPKKMNLDIYFNIYINFNIYNIIYRGERFYIYIYIYIWRKVI